MTAATSEGGASPQGGREAEGAEAPKCSLGDQGPAPQPGCDGTRGRGGQRDPDPAAGAGAAPVPAVPCSSDPSLQGTRAAGASACGSAVRVSVGSGGDAGDPGVWDGGQPEPRVRLQVREAPLGRGRVTGPGKDLGGDEGDSRAARSASEPAAASARLPAVGA